MTVAAFALVCVVAVFAVAIQVAEPVIDGFLRDRAGRRRLGAATPTTASGMTARNAGDRPVKRGCVAASSARASGRHRLS